MSYHVNRIANVDIGFDKPLIDFGSPAKDVANANAANDDLGAGDDEGANSAAGSVDSLLRIFEEPPSEKLDFNVVDLQAQLMELRQLRSETPMDVVSSHNRLCMWVAQNQLQHDPYIRLSVFLLWELIEEEKARGVHPTNSAILFTSSQGYYRADVDLISFTSIDLNANGPSAPGPSTRPNAPGFPRPPPPPAGARPPRATPRRRRPIMRMVKEIIASKGWGFAVSEALGLSG